MAWARPLRANTPRALGSTRSPRRLEGRRPDLASASWPIVFITARAAAGVAHHPIRLPSRAGSPGVSLATSVVSMGKTTVRRRRQPIPAGCALDTGRQADYRPRPARSRCPLPAPKLGFPQFIACTPSRIAQSPARRARNTPEWHRKAKLLLAWRSTWHNSAIRKFQARSRPSE